MAFTTIFGLALAPLYAAIAQIESDRGKTSANVYQIDAHAGGTYVADVNRIVARRVLRVRGVSIYKPESTTDRKTSESMMRTYWLHWGMNYERKTGKPVTYEVLARIHNGGPLGWKKPATVAYWEKVRRVLETQTKADVDAWMGGAK